MRRIGAIGLCLPICFGLMFGAEAKAPAPQERPAAPAWEALGPEGGSISALTLSPSSPNELMALSGLAGFSQVFRTTNGARSWERRATFDKTSWDLAFDPRDANVLTILTDTGILKSLNKGTSWIEFAFGAKRFSAGGKLAVHPADSDTIYATGSYGVATGKNCMAFYKSADGGRTWTAVKFNASSDSGAATALAVSPSRPSTLYLAGFFSTGTAVSYRIYKSVNGGASWSVIGTEIADQVNALLVHPANPDKVWAATSWGIYRSADGGRTWQRNDGFAFGYSLAVDPANPNILYASYDKKCYKSIDGGVNWTEFVSGLFGTGTDIVVTAPAIYFGSTGGIYKSTNGGQTWTAAHSGIQASIIPALGVAPSSAGTVYIEFQADGFYRSLSSGNSWQRLPDFYRCDKVLRIVVNPTNPDKLYILAGG